MVKFLLVLVLILSASPAEAFWIWTPETNKWVNPKFAVKETPAEQLAYAMEAFQAEDYKIALKEFNQLIKHYPRSREAADAQYYIGLTREKTGQVYEAYKDYQLVIERYPFSERAGEIIERQYTIADNLLEGKLANESWMGNIVGNDIKVIEIFRTVIKNAPYGPFAAPAQYKIGLYLKEKRLLQEARDEFEKTINDYPNTEWAKAAKYQVALVDAVRSSDAQYDQQVTKVAVNEFKAFIENHPDTELSDEAKSKIRELRDKEAENNFVVAEFYEKQKNFKAARIYYQTVINDFSDSKWAKKALVQIKEIQSKE